jgi:hypothetical protein
VREHPHAAPANDPFMLIAAAHVGLFVKLSKHSRDEKAREIKNGEKVPRPFVHAIVMESIVFRSYRLAARLDPAPVAIRRYCFEKSYSKVTWIHSPVVRNRHEKLRS